MLKTGKKMGAATESFTVYARQNRKDSERVQINVVPGMTFSKLKKVCGKSLKIRNAKRIFVAPGNEVKFFDEIKQGDDLYISQGENFFGKKDDAAAATNEKFSVSVLGTGGVGKSALTLRFVRDFFVGDWDPTIEDAYQKTCDIDGKVCSLEILDTAGQDDFESLRAQWMMDRDGYVFVYSVDSSSSFSGLEPFYSLHKRINESKGNQVPIILVANKQDIVEKDPSKAKVSVTKARALAEELGASYIEASALTGAGVHEIFETFIRKVRESKKPQKPQPPKCVVS
mmetsp:Transcript_15752/g.17779  ORF Transcript_15752/g.17779 Transcript_15752/m.17779 type:complete len:285 (+) Transcript_15752:492-1346(+)|eukprot:CAMPEP_0184013616 /NCGR_PEP_ID=MMETSP0954-20121128/5122_1 /TAXON_ID=627963 /ORGANISM="Aplanochytrium sp, Strain PBS07" /LENGTH=284 /DNA_ID=CAMNT_0026293845 /DNA_START=465 /DNA_END=1319 /DNA_ORIENTATION=-